MPISVLESSLVFWDWAGYISTTLVFIGVVGESVIELTNWVKLPERSRRIGKISTLILIVGLAGELISTVKISGVTGEITANLKREAGDAKKSADNAADAASRAKASAQQANDEAEKAKLVAGKAKALATEAEAQAIEAGKQTRKTAASKAARSRSPWRPPNSSMRCRCISMASATVG